MCQEHRNSCGGENDGSVGGWCWWSEAWRISLQRAEEARTKRPSSSYNLRSLLSLKWRQVRKRRGAEGLLDILTIPRVVHTAPAAPRLPGCLLKCQLNPKLHLTRSQATRVNRKCERLSFMTKVKGCMGGG